VTTATYVIEGCEFEWRQHLDGGGLSFARDLVDVVKASFESVGHLCEVGAGVGILGLLLLARGCCERLTLVDVNPEAVELARRAIARNGFGDSARAVVGDGLSGLDTLEDVDLVVSNPPHFESRPPFFADVPDLVVVDHGWRMHHSLIGDFVARASPGARMLLIENVFGSRARDLVPPAAARDAVVTAFVPDRPGLGRANVFYYVLVGPPAELDGMAPGDDLLDRPRQVHVVGRNGPARARWRAGEPLTVLLAPDFPPGAAAWLHAEDGRPLLHGLPLAVGPGVEGLRRNELGGLTLTVQPGAYAAIVRDARGATLAEVDVVAD
jgi:hypothetical protein